MFGKLDNTILLPTVLVLACQAASLALVSANAAESSVHEDNLKLFGSSENWNLLETSCMSCHNSDDWYGQLDFSLVDRDKVVRVYADKDKFLTLIDGTVFAGDLVG